MKTGKLTNHLILKHKMPLKKAWRMANTLKHFNNKEILILLTMALKDENKAKEAVNACCTNI